MAERSASEIIPNPDPSVVTAAAIDRAIGNAILIVNARVDGMQKAVDVFQADLTRVPTAVDRAILGLRELIESNIECVKEDLLETRTNVERTQVTIKSEIGHLQALVFTEIKKLSEVSLERFNRIDTQFIERDKRTDQLSLADKTAVAAALQAAKEAVGAQNTSNSIAIAKSESSTVESIRQLQTLFNSAIAAVNDKLNDTRSRLDRGDGSTSGSDRSRVEQRESSSDKRHEAIDSRALVFAVLATCLAGAGFLVAIMTYISSHAR
jgi:hypothetical protein